MGAGFAAPDITSLSLALPTLPYHAKVEGTLAECGHMYDVLFNTLEMDDPYKDTGHVGTNPDLQRKFWEAQKVALGWMWERITTRILQTVWADYDEDEFDHALPYEFVTSFWF